MQGLTLIEATLAGVTTVALLLAVASSWKLRALRQQLHQWQEEQQQAMEALRQENYAMSKGAMGVGQRLVQVEKRLSSTMEKQIEIEQRDPGSIPYAYAVRLVEMGASTEDLINNCGLARVEAELITLIHSEIKAQAGNPPAREERYTLN